MGLPNNAGLGGDVGSLKPGRIEDAQGVISTTLTPNQDGVYDISSTSPLLRMRNGFFTQQVSAGFMSSFAQIQLGDGTAYRANIYSVSGVPPAGLGNNGDFAFRQDTPGVANQRLYVKSAGAWVGIA